MSTILETIDSPRDLKKLTREQLRLLAGEIRQALVKTVSKTGGHLASNLGVVELTLALHYCFDMPTDKIVWDVGHQAYVHKLLTGRRDRFATIRRKGGLSGFPRPAESVYDSFGAGHASTAISAAFGMAAARDLGGGKERILAVIGDGAMTGGLAYEALNNAGRAGKDFIVVLNDNEMSIERNVGALSRHLNDIRTSPRYVGAKRGVEGFLRRVPVVGGGAVKFVEGAKDKLRYFLLPGVLFEELGYNYIGPIDGHDLEQLINTLNNIKNISGPILLHVLTKKGKGYPKAEKSPAAFHGVAAADQPGGRTAYTDVFAKAVTEIACEDSRVVAVTASMPQGTGLARFSNLFPNRCFDVGIAEGHAVTFAAGMAKAGLKPVVAVYSTFLQRAYDQIVHDVAIQNLPVVFAVDRAGVVGADGETHQGAFDLAFLSHIPNMTVLAPKNGRELADMLRWAFSLGRPVAVRYPRAEASDCFDGFSSSVELGRAEFLAEGDGRAALVCVGAMMDAALAAAGRLKAEGVNPAIVNARFVKPVDQAIIERLKGFEFVYTVEDGVLRGGFGERMAYMFNAAGSAAKLRAIGLPDAFIEHGGREETLAELGLDADGIYAAVKRDING